eukprot:1179040-Prorocentrum_minimum.AAC.1
MCPLKALLALGCTVVAIQRPSARVVKLIQAAKASPGTLVLPAKAGTDTTGMSDETLAQVRGRVMIVSHPQPTRSDARDDCVTPAAASE